MGQAKIKKIIEKILSKNIFRRRFGPQNLEISNFLNSNLSYNKFSENIFGLLDILTINISTENLIILEIKFSVFFGSF